MSKSLASTMLALLMATSLIGIGGAAYAEGEAIEVTATDIVYKTDDCYSSDITVLGLDAENPDTYDIEVTGPDGQWVAGESVYGQSEDFFSAMLCAGSEPVGTYTVQVNGVTYASFNVTKPWIKLKRLSKRTVAGRLLVNGHGMAYRTIHVQVWMSDDWYDVLDVRTNRYGQFGIVCRRHHRCPWAFRFDYRYFVNSRSFHLYTGPRNGLVADGTPTRDNVHASLAGR